MVQVGLWPEFDLPRGMLIFRPEKLRGRCAKLVTRRGDALAMSEDYVRFNQYEDALASLEVVALVAPLISQRPQYWKWVIVGAHNALQGAMVCALFDRAAVLRSPREDNLNAAQEAKALGVPQEWVENRIEDFQVLLKRCVAGNTFCAPLELTPVQRERISKLHSEFRNSFLHFGPRHGWSIEIAMLRPMIVAALDAAEGLMRRSYVIGHLDHEQQRRLNDAITTARTYLQAL